MTRKKPHKLKAGMVVKVRGKVRILSRPIWDIAGGWVLDKPVDGFACWNEQDMKIVPEKRKK